MESYLLFTGGQDRIKSGKWQQLSVELPGQAFTDGRLTAIEAIHLLSFRFQHFLIPPPPALRRIAGRSVAAVKCGSRAVEKSIEAVINRRFKRQGRSWNPQRAERLLQLKLRGADEHRWTHWWHAKPEFITGPNAP